MVSVTTNYIPKPLSPKVLIYKRDGTLHKTFESDLIDATPTQDFTLTDYKLKLGINDNYGSLTLVIDDNTGALIDSTKSSRPCVIEREGSVQFSLGKDSATLDRWFYGKIRDVDVVRAGTGQSQIIITCIGWGIVLRERMTRLVRNQLKDEVIGDGVTLDDTDNNARVDELIKDLFQDVDHYVDDNIPALGNFTVASTTDGTGICSNCLSMKIANINTTVSTIAQVISDLTGIGNSTWFVDPDRRVVIHDPEAHDSGFLFTSDLESTEAASWSSDKIGYILNNPISWNDTSNDTYYNWIHAFGHFSPKLDVSEEAVPDAADNLDTMWHAISFTPTEDNVFKIAVKSIKTGTPAADGSVQIWGDDGTGKPDPADIKRVVQLNHSTLQKLGTSTPAPWFEIPVKPKLDVVPGEKLWIVFRKYGTASHTFNINYDAGNADQYFYDSSDGVTWNQNTAGTTPYRVYSAKRLFTSLELMEAEDTLPEPKERMFPIRADLEEQTVRQTLLHAAVSLGQQRRIYSEITISPTDARIVPGYFCIIQDKKTGLYIKALITQVSVEAHIDNNRLGADAITLTLEEFHSP